MKKLGRLNLFKILSIALLSLNLLTSCTEKEVSLKQPQANQAVEQDESVSTPIESAPSLLFSQNFENFDTQRSWYTSDFGMNSDTERSEYVSSSEVKFRITWTKRARNLMADRLEIDRELMTNDYAQTVCEPRIEVGKESVYTSSSSSNFIAELDSDLSHCGISGTSPATVSLSSFIPTKIGYKYKVNVTYKMRTYNAQVAKSYKDLVVRFGSELEKFDPVYDDFVTVSVEMTSTQRFSKLVFRDNGLPDSYGILIDDIEISEIGKSSNYDSCKSIFNISSKGFKKCISGDVVLTDSCDFNSLEDTHVSYKAGAGVTEDRQDTAKAFTVAPSTTGSINFLSLGLKGSLRVSCKVGGYPALYSIFGKTISMREISWGNASPESYPEVAKVRVRLEDCDEEVLNRVNTIGTIHTNESFQVTFDENSDGISYSGCMMSRLIVKDITPQGPSKDGFDLNSIQFID